MKTRILKSVFPLLAFIFAIGASFAFKPAPSSADAPFLGARKVSLHDCQMTSIQCTDVNTGIICKDKNNVTLYKFINGTSCPEQLWKP